VQFRLTSVYGEVLRTNVTVPTSTWVQQEQWLAFPPIVSNVQFTTSRAPPSSDANSYYKHCLSSREEAEQRLVTAFAKQAKGQ